jgi:hypothetical protein
MKRSFVALFVGVVLVCGVGSTALAQKGNIGRIGVGYTISNAPLGVRYWMDEDLGFDVGLGLVFHGEEDEIETDDDPDDTTTTADYALDLGILYAFSRSTNSVFFGRGSINYDRRYAPGFDRSNPPLPIHSSITTLTLAGWAGIELFMAEFGFPELSLQGAVGLAYENVSGPDNDGDDNADWALGSLTTGLSLVSAAQIGFHYYF